MAFGLLQTKWAVLKRNLTTGLETTAKVLEVCARLHNYVIDENKVVKDISGLSGSDEADDIQEILAEITPVYNSPLGWGYLPTVEKLDVISLVLLSFEMLFLKELLTWVCKDLQVILKEKGWNYMS
jgi:hypothetical protein